MRNSKKLYRSRKDKVISGVAGGLADYFDIDVVIFRLLFVLLALMGGGGVIGYIILWIVAPMEPAFATYTDAPAGNQPDPGKTQADSPEGKRENSGSNSDRKSNTSMIAGIILILVGLFFLANRLMPWFQLENFWPLLLIIGGVFIIEPNLIKSKK